MNWNLSNIWEQFFKRLFMCVCLCFARKLEQVYAFAYASVLLMSIIIVLLSELSLKKGEMERWD